MTEPVKPYVQRLQEAAEKATPGPWMRSGVREKWRVSYSDRLLDGHTVGPDDSKGWVALIPYDEHNHAEDYGNSNYIALANPTAILALAKSHEELREALTDILAQCHNGGYPNEIVATRMIERIEEFAIFALKQAEALDGGR